MAKTHELQDIRNALDTPPSAQVRKLQQLAEIDEGFSVKNLIRRMPNYLLVPGLVGLFALLLADMAIADPLPVIDEAAIFWLLMNGLKVFGERRKTKTEPLLLEDDLDVVADVYPESTTIRDDPYPARSM
jgi:hypothetical protein